MRFLQAKKKRTKKRHAQWQYQCCLCRDLSGSSTRSSLVLQICSSTRFCVQNRQKPLFPLLPFSKKRMTNSMPSSTPSSRPGVRELLPCCCPRPGLWNAMLTRPQHNQRNCFPKATRWYLKTKWHKDIHNESEEIERNLAQPILLM